jgi:hypothetical protein
MEYKEMQQNIKKYKWNKQSVNISDCIFCHCSVLKNMVHDIIRAVIFSASFAVIAKELFISILDSKRWSVIICLILLWSKLGTKRRDKIYSRLWSKWNLDGL